MIRYNELKLRVLSLFESASRDWLGPSEVAEGSISCPRARRRDYGRSACWRGVRQV